MGSQQAAAGTTHASRVQASKAAAFGGFHYLVALAVAVVALVVYLTTLAGGVLPGEPAQTLLGLSGAEANLVVRHVVWRKLVGLAVVAGGSSFSLVVNASCAVVSALGVGLM